MCRLHAENLGDEAADNLADEPEQEEQENRPDDENDCMVPEVKPLAPDTSEGPITWWNGHSECKCNGILFYFCRE